MSLVKVKQNFQITIPNTIRKYLNISVGDYLEVEKQDSVLILKPVKFVRPEQAYFYTKEWQEGEAQVDKEIKNGDVLGPFDNIADGLQALKSSEI